MNVSQKIWFCVYVSLNKTFKIPLSFITSKLYLIVDLLLIVQNEPDEIQTTTHSVSPLFPCFCEFSRFIEHEKKPQINKIFEKGKNDRYRPARGCKPYNKVQRLTILRSTFAKLRISLADRGRRENSRRPRLLFNS